MTPCRAEKFAVQTGRSLTNLQFKVYGGWITSSVSEIQVST